jgi:DNA-binding NarL/FixJ family response regulator
MAHKLKRRRLTDRQMEVARLIARDFTYKAIAKELCLAPGTVTTHVTEIRAKLGVASHVGIAVWVVMHDLGKASEQAG